MSASNLLLAILCASVFVGCGVAVAIALWRRFFAHWTGADAVLVCALIWICWALLLGQLLGAVGLLRRGALLVSALITAAIAVATSAPTAPSPSRQPGPETTTTTEASRQPEPETTTSVATLTVQPSRRGDYQAHLALLGATVLLVGVVAAIWVTRTAITVHRGINDPDSLGYHLPFATTFVQTGYANQHRYLYPDLPVQFYPANDELLVAIGLALTHSVAFAAVKNLLYGALTLLGAYAIGKTYRAGLAAVAGAALVLGLPVIAFSQPGEAVNDTLLVLVLVGAVALLAHADNRPAPYVLAAACLGVAAGVKFSALWACAAIGVLAMVLLWRRVGHHRGRWLAAVIGSALALGGSWYLRNALAYGGNPIPPTKVDLGPVQLRQIPTAAGPKSYTIFQFLKQGLLLAQFRHGLVLGLGTLAVAVVAVWAVGAVASIVTGDRFVRGLGLVALVCAFGYVETPASAWGIIGPGHSVAAFVINLHYAFGALILGTVAFGLGVGRTRAAWLFPTFGVVVAVWGIRSGQRIAFWSPGMGAAGFKVLLAGAVVAAVAAVAVRLPGLRWVLAAGGAIAAMALVGAVLAARHYPSQPATDPVQRWAARTTGARIAAWVPDVADLYGPGSPNRVVTLYETSDRAPVPLTSCAAWKDVLVLLHFDYTAVVPLTAWNNWMLADPAFKLVARDQFLAVYEVVGQPDLGCPGQG